MAKSRPKASSARTSAREKTLFLKTLRENRQVVPAGEPLPAGATHEESRSRSGKVTVVRKRFSAR